MALSACSIKWYGRLEQGTRDRKIHRLHLPNRFVAEDLRAANLGPVLTVILLQVLLGIVGTVQLEISKLFCRNVFYLVVVIILLFPGVLTRLVPDHNLFSVFLHHKNITEWVPVAKNFVRNFFRVSFMVNFPEICL